MPRLFGRRSRRVVVFLLTAIVLPALAGAQGLPSSDAAKAADWGLVSKAVPADTLMDEAMALATRIAQQPPHALRMAKSLLKHGQTASYDTLMEMSAAAQAIAHHTDDHMEGVDAILEKRQPNFRGS